MRQSALITADFKGRRKIRLVAGDGKAEFRAAVAGGRLASVELATLTATKRWRSPSRPPAAKKTPVQEPARPAKN